jgi:hypothetical protein
MAPSTPLRIRRHHDFFLPPRRLVVFREVLREVLLRADFRGGTFAPFSRASLRPIAIACFRLFTVCPDPLLSVPRFRRRIADSTFFDADLPYLAKVPSNT